MSDDRKPIEGEELDKVSGGYSPVDPRPPTNPVEGHVHDPIEIHHPSNPAGG